jgi:hypothetical protein
MRRLGQICTGLFAVSSLFPITASLYPPDAPSWMGLADVACAAVLLIVTIRVAKRVQKHITDDDRLAAFRASQLIVSAIPVLLLLFFVAGNRIKWDVLVIGLAWRTWLLLYTLPSLIAAYRQS